MLLDKRPYTLDRVFRLAIAAALVWALVWLLRYLSDVLIPFALAFLLAYLLNPVVRRVQRKAKSRVAAVAVVLVATLVVVVVLGWVLVDVIAGEVVNFGRLMAKLVGDSQIAQRAAKSLPPDLWRALHDWLASEDVQQTLQGHNFWQWAVDVARRVLPGLWSVVSTAVGFVFFGLVGVAAVALYVVFLLLDYERVSRRWQELLPPRYRPAVTAFLRDTQAAMRKYFRAQAAIAAIVGVLFAVGFSVIGLPLGVLLGLFVGVLNMVPYLQNIALIPAAFLALLHALETGGSFWWILAQVAVVFVVVQAIQDGLLVPKIMGSATGLRPAVILLSLAVWGKLLGVLGLLIALPLTCVLWAYYRRLLARDTDEPGAPRSPPDPAPESAGADGEQTGPENPPAEQQQAE